MSEKDMVDEGYDEKLSCSSIQYIHTWWCIPASNLLKVIAQCFLR